MRIIYAAAAVLVCSAPAAARADDTGANAVYERMAAAHAALDAAALEGVYAPGATYLSRNARFDIHTRERVLGSTRSFHEQLRVRGGSIDIRFRLTERKRFGDVVVDNGYVRTTYTPARGAPGQTTTGKFVTVLARQPDGRWAIVTDADADTPPEAYDTAPRRPGLKYDG